MIKQINEASEFLKSRGFLNPQIGIVLGTGLGNLAKEINVELSISYADIPNFPVSTVESHSGKLLFGTLAGKKVIAMQGRFHFYEGYSCQEIVFPIRVLKFLGISTLLISNASGALNLEFKKGELMMITDHINFLPDNPLRGVNDNALGIRFPDMSEPYDLTLRDKLIESAKDINVKLHQGVYVSVQGPMLETKAEYKMLRNFGADAVGMSTVPEVIAAVHLGLKVAAVSVLTDECDPENLHPVNIDEIISVANTAEKKLAQLFTTLINQL